MWGVDSEEKEDLKDKFIVVLPRLDHVLNTPMDVQDLWAIEHSHLEILDNEVSLS